MEEKTAEIKETSFRGEPIPSIQKKDNYKVADSQQVIDKIVAMKPDEQQNVTIDAVHYQDSELSAIKLSTGDIISVEAAIALAENALLKGFRAGRNAKGDKTLRAVPNYNGKGKNSIHYLPRF